MVVNAKISFTRGGLIGMMVSIKCNSQCQYLTIIVGVLAVPFELADYPFNQLKGTTNGNGHNICGQAKKCKNVS